jgi:hypothetical protein
MDRVGARCRPAVRPGTSRSMSRARPEGMSCDTLSLDCDYGDKRCECASGPSRQSATTTWRCTDEQLAGPGCGARPHLGDPCPQDGLSCNYGACKIAGGTVEDCRGVWMQLSYGNACLSCPPGIPEAGSRCAPIGICEYGTSNVYDCDTIALCWLLPALADAGVSGPFGPPAMRWIVSNSDAGGASCQTPPQGACPPSFDAVPRDAGCAGAPSFCDYQQGRCRCAADPGTAGPTWSCQDPAPSCPKPRPRLGSDCSQEGLRCEYAPCKSPDGIAQICQSVSGRGSWLTAPWTRDRPAPGPSNAAFAALVSLSLHRRSDRTGLVRRTQAPLPAAGQAFAQAPGTTTPNLTPARPPAAHRWRFPPRRRAASRCPRCCRFRMPRKGDPRRSPFSTTRRCADP